MSVSRRGFLSGMLALGAAPAIAKASSLMKIVKPQDIPTGIWVPQGGYRRGEIIVLSSDYDGDRVSLLKGKPLRGANMGIVAIYEAGFLTSSGCPIYVATAFGRSKISAEELIFDLPMSVKQRSVV